MRCSLWYGSDGILLKVPSINAGFGLKIYNPDGSEAEKSGNGLRIFCKFSLITVLPYRKNSQLKLRGGIVTAKIIGELDGKAGIIEVEMGKANFISKEIPVLSAHEECMDEKIKVLDKEFFIQLCFSR